MSLESVFGRLPVELCEEIIATAAWQSAERDKRWLCALVTVSRHVRSFVLPALYDTVCVTDSNIPRVLATGAGAPHFRLTTRLWTNVVALKWENLSLWDLFPNVNHLSAGPLYLHHPKRASLQVCCFAMHGRLWEAEWATLSTLRHVTHLRMALDAYYGIPRTLDGLSAGTTLRVIVLESQTPGWNPSKLVGVFLPFFLACSSLQRLLVCATTHARYMDEVYAALEEYARVHQERRLWVLDKPTDGKLLGKFKPGVTFDPEQWTAGRQLYNC